MRQLVKKCRSELKMVRMMDRKMTTTIPAVFLMLILVVAAQVIIPVHAAPKTIWTVDDSGGADFDNIKDAVEAAEEGDKIYVYAGTYIESLTITKEKLTLTGEDAASTIIDGGIYLSADKVKITGFTVTNGYHGINIVGADGCVIIGNIIKENCARARLLDIIPIIVQKN